MSIKIDSTTDSEADVTAALGKLAPSESKEEKSASADEKSADEKPEESDASEKEESKDSDSKNSEPDEDDDSQDDEAKEDDKPKKKNGFKKRIDKLNKRFSDKEREAEYWKQEALKRSSNQEPQQQAAKPVVTEGKPAADSFDSHEEYVEALADWKVEQKLKSHDAKQKEVQLKTDFQKRVDSHVERVKSFSADHEDFQDLMEEVDDVPMSITVQEIILDSDNGPQLMYELAKNREEYERICKLPAVAAARELGKFEARIAKSESEKTTPEIKKTKAPPPIKPVGSKASASTKSPDEMDYQEYKKWRETQLQR